MTLPGQNFCLPKSVRALVCCLGLLLPGLAQAVGGCSPQIGNATLNEYNYMDNFTEIKKSGSGVVDLTGWKVTVYTATRTTEKILPASGTSSCLGGTYQVSQFAANEISQNADVVLSDSNGDLVDIVRVRTSLPVATSYYGASIPSCGFVGGPSDLLVASSNKGVDRLPDGSGAWRNTPGTGSNSFQSRCGPNVVGGSADLAVSKSANVSSVVMGDAVTFTIVITNNGTGSASNVLVDDLLPGGFAYFSHLAGTGSYDYVTGVWSIGTLAAGSTATLSITATTTQVGSIANTAIVRSQTYDPASSNNSSSATVTVTSPPSAKLDAVEPAAAAGTRIFTKLAGQPFSLDLLALNTSGGAPVINASYNKTVTIQLVDGSSSPTCSAMVKLQDAGTHTFNGSGASKDNGRWNHTFTYANAARNVRVRMIDDNSTPIISCSTDNFAIRPHALVVASTAATNADPTGVSTTATPALKAGAAFALTAKAVVLPAATTLTGYDGTPVADPAKINAHAGAVATGVTSGNFGAAVAGLASGNAFQYSEVGYFQFAAYGVYDANFTAVDQPAGCRATNSCDCVASTALAGGVPENFSTLASGGKYGCDIGNAASTSYIGRFYPDRFVLTVPRFVNRNDISGCDLQTIGAMTAASFSLVVASAAGFAVGDVIIVRGAGNSGTDLIATVGGIAGTTFTLSSAAASTIAGATVYKLGFSYQNEPMALGFVIGAYNGLATPAVTRNYSGAWAGGTVSLQAEDGNNGIDLGSRLTTNTAANWGSGVYTLNASNAQFLRGSSPDGPYDSLQIGATVNDPDGAVLLGRNMNPTTVTDCVVAANCTGVAVANTRMRFGRLKLSNAHGSELLKLPVPAETQYWNGGLFITNTADSCTTLAAANVTLVKSPASCTTALGANALFAAGRASLVLSRPNAACRADLSVSLGSEGKTYLQGRWSGSSYDQNPGARATFGIYKNGPLIYMREMY